LFAEEVEDVSTGDASNENHTSMDASVSNSTNLGGQGDWMGGGGDYTISNTGNRSDNKIEVEQEVEVDVENKTDIYIHNENDQDAHSGWAVVGGVEEAEDVSTGDASNENRSEFNVSVDNSTHL
jgi:hypothetical protein